MSGGTRDREGDPLLSVVLVSFNQRELLRACLRSLDGALAQIPGSTEVLVVDNASGDGSAAMVAAEFPHARIVALAGNTGFAGAAQRGVQEARGTWLFYLGTDATVAPGALALLLAEATARPGVGAAAAQMRFADRPQIVNSAGLDVDRLGTAFDVALGAVADELSPEVAYVFGASAGAALYRAEMLDQVGGFDASFFMYLEDADLAWRARRLGWKAIAVPAAVVLHAHSTSAGHRSDLKYFMVGRNRVRLLAKNATTGQLLRYGTAIVLYDVAYVAYALVIDRTTAPLRGRLAGLRDWRRYRAAAGAPAAAVALAPARGLRAALRRNATVAGRATA